MSDIYFLPPNGSSVLPEAVDLLPTAAEDTRAFYGREPQYVPMEGADATSYDMRYELVTDEDGHVVMVEGSDALAQSIAKQLRTERLEHLAYGPDYGNDTAIALATPLVGSTAQDLALVAAMEVLGSDERVAATDEVDATLEFPDGDDAPGYVSITGDVLDVFGESFTADLTYPIPPLP